MVKQREDKKVSVMNEYEFAAWLRSMPRTVTPEEDAERTREHDKDDLSPAERYEARSHHAEAH